MNSTWIDKLNNSNHLQVISSTNNYTRQFGLELSEQDVQQLITARDDSLKKTQRVEIFGTIVPDIIYAFCDSPYIMQDNYKTSLSRLIEIFYEFKNELEGYFTDIDIINIMKKEFDGSCGGDFELLESKVLSNLNDYIKKGPDIPLEDYDDDVDQD